MGVEWWLKFYLPLRTTEYSFDFRAMNFLIGFPPVSSLNFRTTFCWYPQTRNGPHRNLKSRNQLLFSPSLGKRHQFSWQKQKYPCRSKEVPSLDLVSFLIMKLKHETLGEV